MRYVVSAAAVAAALMLMSASGSMNFLFWLGQGQTEREFEHSGCCFGRLRYLQIRSAVLHCLGVGIAQARLCRRRLGAIRAVLLLLSFIGGRLRCRQSWPCLGRPRGALHAPG